MRDRRQGVLLGAAFLMATSAIGPGFLTQTAVFTERLGPSFAFAILVSVLVDLAAQVSIWRVLTVSGKRATEVGNLVAKGLGTALALLVALGGLAFNVGNVAGTGVGLEAAVGLPVIPASIASAALAIGIFVTKDAGRILDRLVVVLGACLIALMLYVAVTSGPPVAEAALRSVWPETVDALSIVTIVGGTVGGYITFAGAHRLVDAGVHGLESVTLVTQSAVTAISAATLMRVVLFLAALGVVHQGLRLDPANPAGSVFRLATGDAGFRLFGVVMWCAAVTSLIGAAYTSVSFLRDLHPAIDRHWQRAVIVLIAVSTLIFVLTGRPARTLVVVGTLNGLILPLALGTMLVAAYRRDIIGEYRQPRLLTAAGAVAALAMAVAGAYVAVRDLPGMFR
ncbi:MAG: divalent metal cation transporter [Gemmatimonadaceae bacterium]|nr:divalent metal cation transporter [Gemmatimonadaceae bacterium]